MGSVGEERTYPLKRPRGHKAPVPRWSLKFPDTVTHICTLYIGLQCRLRDAAVRDKTEDIIEALLNRKVNDDEVPAVDTFRVTDGFDLEVW